MTLRRNINNAVIAILVAVFGAALCSSALAVQPWEEPFFNPCPETRGPWTFSTQKLKADKDAQWGWIPGAVGSFQTEKGAWRSYGENESIRSWTGAYPRSEGGESYRLTGGFSMSNDISTWLAPPPGVTRNIKFSVLREEPGVLNNADIFEVDENQVEALPLIFGAQTDPPSDNLGIVDPYKGADRNVTGLEYKTDLAPDRFKYNHTQALHNDFGKYITNPVMDQTGENIYCSLSKTGKFNPDGSLLYGAHSYMASLGGEFMWGSESGSGYARAGRAVFDQQGDVSGEYFNSEVSKNPANDRWWGEITISGTTYQLYLEDTDGSIKPYDASKYPEDPGNPLDPEAASGYPVRWHDAYEVQETYGMNWGLTGPGQDGGYLAERGENIFWKVYQSEAHEADVLGEVRTFDPYVNDDGPQSPYNWVHDGSGNMYTPNYYWDGDVTHAPTPYAGEWNSDTVQERAAHLIGIESSWTETNETTSDPATPPDGEHNWECMGETSPGSSVYNWRTFSLNYLGVDQHPAYPDDDHSSSWTDWAWDPGSETWLPTDYEDDLEDNDWKIGVNANGGIVEQTVFEHAWRLAELMLYSAGSRPFEDLGYVWDTKEGCVAEIIPVENDFLDLGSFSLKLPVMSWNDINEAWEFTDAISYDTIWGFFDHDTYSPMAGFETINDFIKYVFDIDSVVIQDVDGDGHFDPGVDYILFSLVDDGLYNKMLGWDNQAGGVVEETPFQGQYFDGDVIFLYDGYSVITYFDPDPANSIFFGEYYETLDPTLWSGGYGFDYELDALDIGLTGVIPEPATMMLLIGGCAAATGGLIRRKIRG